MGRRSIAGRHADWVSTQPKPLWNAKHRCKTQKTNKRGQRPCELVPDFGNAFDPDSANLSVQKHKTTLFRTFAPCLLWTISIVVPTLMLFVFAVAVSRACRFDIVLVFSLHEHFGLHSFCLLDSAPSARCPRLSQRCGRTRNVEAPGS